MFDILHREVCVLYWYIKHVCEKQVICVDNCKQSNEKCILFQLNTNVLLFIKFYSHQLMHFFI